MVNFLAVLPLAFVMVAGTQLIAAVFLATGRDARRISAAYLAGAAVAVLAGVTVAYWLVRLLKVSIGVGRGEVGHWIDLGVLVLLIVLIVIVFVRRKHSEPPSWMGRLEDAGPGFAFTLGLLLIVAMPSDDLTMLTVGASLARHDRSWRHVLPFVGLTLLLLAIPLICLLVFRDRAAALLPRIRDWANAHSWVVSEVMLVLFVGFTVASLLK